MCMRDAETVAADLKEIHKVLRVQPEWPMRMLDNWLLLTPADKEGWPNLWRVQASNVEHISAGMLVMVKGEIEFFDCVGYAAIIVHKDQIAAHVTKPPKNTRELVSWDKFTEERKRAHQQQMMAMQRAQAGNLLVPQ